MIRRIISAAVVALLALAGAPAFGQATLNFNAFTLQGQIPNANILNPSTTVNGVECVLGTTCTVPGSASIGVGSTTIDSGTSGRVLYDNAGVLGELPVTGSGSAVLATSPTIASPTLTSPTSSNSVQTGTSIINAAALGGCTIGSDTLCVTGSTTSTGTITADKFVPTSAVAPTNGLYLSAANTLGFATASTARWSMGSNTLSGAAASSAALLNTAASATVPTFAPNKTDTTTGIGAQASGKVSIIVGGAETTRYDTTGLRMVAGQVLSTAGSAGAPGISFNNDLVTGIYRDVANQIAFSTNGTEAFRLGSTNNATIGGGTLSPQVSLQILNPPGTGQTTLYGFRNSTTLPSTATGTFRAFYGEPSTSAAAFTATNILNYDSTMGTIGAGSSISNFFGFRQTDVTIPGASVYGFRGEVSSGLGRWNLYMTGTAANYLAGVTTFDAGTASISTGTGSVVVNGGAGISGAVWAGGDVNSAGAILSTSTSGGVGYATGAGGSVTQTGSKSATVALNRVTGTIVMNNAALAAGAEVQFTFNNNQMGANDSIVVNHRAGGTFGAYLIQAQPGNTTSTISVRNVSAGSLSEAVQIKFSIIKGTAS